MLLTAEIAYLQRLMSVFMHSMRLYIIICVLLSAIKFARYLYDHLFDNVNLPYPTTLHPPSSNQPLYNIKLYKHYVVKML